MAEAVKVVEPEKPETDRQRRHKYLALVESDEVQRAAEEPTINPKAMVWPHLLAVEFLAALIVIVFLLAFSVLRDAPLLELANPDVTPNPSKAPWYFTNIQEILLHMHPMLAGIFLVGAVLTGLAVIPYIDDSRSEVGVWFGSAKAVQITIFATIYTFVITVLLIFLDSRLGGVPGTAGGMDELLSDAGAPDVVGGWILPILVMVGFTALLAVVVRVVWDANTYQVIMALFTGFVVVYTVTTIVGFLFRGPGFELYWPWEMPPEYNPWDEF
ncbi:MAG: menaquinol-cytochrome C reductase [Anaerolineae bacterium]